MWSAAQAALPAIRAYLNEHEDEAAQLLGHLADGADEAAYELERRTGTHPEDERARASAVADLAAAEEELGRLAGMGDAPDRRIAEALEKKGCALCSAARREDGIRVLEELAARFADSPDVAVRAEVASGLFMIAQAHSECGRAEEELATFSRLIDLFGSEVEPRSRDYVQMGVGNRAAVLHELGRLDEALVAYRERVARSEETVGARSPEDDTEALVTAADGLLDLGITLGELGRPEEQLGVYEELLARFEDELDGWQDYDDAYDNRRELRGQVLQALMRKALVLGDLGRDSAAEVFEQLAARLGDPDDLLEPAAEARRDPVSPRKRQQRLRDPNPERARAPGAGRRVLGAPSMVRQRVDQRRHCLAPLRREPS